MSDVFITITTLGLFQIFLVELFNIAWLGIGYDADCCPLQLSDAKQLFWCLRITTLKAINTCVEAPSHPSNFDVTPHQLLKSKPSLRGNHWLVVKASQLHSRQHVLESASSEREIKGLCLETGYTVRSGIPKHQYQSYSPPYPSNSSKLKRN